MFRPKLFLIFHYFTQAVYTNQGPYGIQENQSHSSIKIGIADQTKTANQI